MIGDNAALAIVYLVGWGIVGALALYGAVALSKRVNGRVVTRSVPEGSNWPKQPVPGKPWPDASRLQTRDRERAEGVAIEARARKVVADLELARALRQARPVPAIVEDRYDERVKGRFATLSGMCEAGDYSWLAMAGSDEGRDYGDEATGPHRA